jgi:hypothetical protein
MCPVSPATCNQQLGVPIVPFGNHALAGLLFNLALEEEVNLYGALAAIHRIRPIPHPKAEIDQRCRSSDRTALQIMVPFYST